MRLTRLPLPQPLRRAVHQMWIFESASRLPPGDLRTVVPNGRTRLILPLRGALTAAGQGRTWTLGAGRAGLVGQWDKPAVLSAPAAPLVTLGVEFTATGLALLCPEPQMRLARGIHALDALMPDPGGVLLTRITSAESPREAAMLLQKGLLQRLLARAPGGETLAEATIRLMRGAGLAADMGWLEQRTRYSRRYLAAVFQRDVGLSPARLQTILAFEALYRDFARHGVARAMVDAALDRFHDQPHFTRVFRAMTGLPPARFAASGNAFGQLFYRD